MADADIMTVCEVPILLESNGRALAGQSMKSLKFTGRKELF